MKKLALAATLLLASGVTTAYAETVNWLHITSNPEELAIMEAAAREYESMNPDITVNMQFLENEAFKAKLTTLLQSDAAPDIFYSWGGGVLTDQAEAGVLRDISDVVSQETLDSIGTAGVDAFTRDGNLYGLAQHVSQVTIWYNKDLMAQGGVDPSELETWEGFLGAVQKLKDAGITPLAMGGKDKWPAMFHWAYLVVRVAGQDAFEAAVQQEGEGFEAEPFVRAGDMLAELAALEPWQEGYLAATFPDAAGVFGDGRAAMYLMGDWLYGAQKENSASGQGLSDDQMGIASFPQVEGGAGDPTDTLGGIQGWLLSKNASDEDVKFLEWYLSKPVMERFAEAGFFIPIAAGAADAFTNPFKKQVGNNISNANWHALFFDQLLSKQAGLVVNDVAIELADGAMTGAEAAEIVNEAVADDM